MKKNNFGTKVFGITLALLTVFIGSCGVDSPLGLKEDLSSLKKNDSTSLSHTKKFDGEVAYKWFDLLTEVIKAKPYFNSQALRFYSYSGIALYESVVPGMPSYQSIFTYLTGNTITYDKKKDYYWPATANAAIARIASKLMQDYPTPDLTEIEALETSFNSKFLTSITPEQLEYSIEFGRYVGDMIYEWSKSDGTLDANGNVNVCPPYVLVGGPYNWVPTPPFYFPAAGACQGLLRTYIPNIVNSAIAAPPLDNSIDFDTDFNLAAQETFEARNNITTDQFNQFNNWRDSAPNYSPLTHMLLISTKIIKEENVDLEVAATLYAKLTMAASDVITAVFYSKFYYSIMRPVSYIRNNFDATWLSLPITPQTPAYPDELAATASSVEILEEYFGKNYSFVDDIHASTHGEWSYTNFDQMLNNIVQARVSGGTIYRFAGDAGVVQGRFVGNAVNNLPFKKP